MVFAVETKEAMNLWKRFTETLSLYVRPITIILPAEDNGHSGRTRIQPIMSGVRVSRQTGG